MVGGAGGVKGGLEGGGVNARIIMVDKVKGGVQVFRFVLHWSHLPGFVGDSEFDGHFELADGPAGGVDRCGAQGFESRCWCGEI